MDGRAGYLDFCEWSCIIDVAVVCRLDVTHDLLNLTRPVNERRLESLNEILVSGRLRDRTHVRVCSLIIKR
jgi:hypothetical protein